MKNWGHKNKESVHQLKKLWIVKPILLVSTIWNVYRRVWRIWVHLQDIYRAVKAPSRYPAANMIVWSLWLPVEPDAILSSPHLKLKHRKIIQVYRSNPINSMLCIICQMLKNFQPSFIHTTLEVNSTHQHLKGGEGKDPNLYISTETLKVVWL